MHCDVEPGGHVPWHGATEQQTELAAGQTASVPPQHWISIVHAAPGARHAEMSGTLSVGASRVSVKSSGCARSSTSATAERSDGSEGIEGELCTAQATMRTKAPSVNSGLIRIAPWSDGPGACIPRRARGTHGSQSAGRMTGKSRAHRRPGGAFQPRASASHGAHQRSPVTVASTLLVWKTIMSSHAKRPHLSHDDSHTSLTLRRIRDAQPSQRAETRICTSSLWSCSEFDLERLVPRVDVGVRRRAGL
jgi:hypothetical protein